jgi:hypothetical protein
MGGGLEAEEVVGEFGALGGKRTQTARQEVRVEAHAGARAAECYCIWT